MKLATRSIRTVTKTIERLVDLTGCFIFEGLSAAGCTPFPFGLRLAIFGVSFRVSTDSPSFVFF